MKRKRWTRSEKLLFGAPLVFVVLASGLLHPPRDRVFRGDVLRQNLWLFSPRENRRFACYSNVRQLGLAVAQYTQDFDDRLPLVATSATDGWANAIFPYVKSRQLFSCPQRAVPFSRLAPLWASDYYFNARLATRKMSDVPAEALLLGEGNDGFDWNDASYAKSELPAQWRTGAGSPARRHLTNEVWAKATGNYLCFDWHVARLAPAEIGAHLTKK